MTNIGGPFFEILVSFATAGGTDLVITDPTDSSTVLEANIQAGTFNGSPTTDL